ncbi:MAG: hypothetical protein ABSG21_11065 [Spirochaetia bacterium]
MIAKSFLGAFVTVALAMALTEPAAAEDRTPQPYSPDEFQAWMKEAWRAEAVLVGSFPFALFATLEAYDTVRYVSNSFSPSYAPWPFGSGTAVSYSAEETLWLALSAVSLSMVISGVDFLLGRINERSHGH